MLVEGRGLCAPQRIGRRFTSGEMRGVLDQVLPQAEKYRHRRDEWGRGLLQGRTLPCGLVVPTHAVSLFAGRLLEMVVADDTNRRLGTRARADSRVLARGDGGVDLFLLGVGTQCKARCSPRGVSLIRCVDARGNEVPLAEEAKVYVFGEWLGGYVAEVIGWTERRRLVDRVPVPARKGRHRNLEIADEELEPLSRLYTLLKIRRTEPWQ